MKRKRQTTEEIIKKLCEAAGLIAGGIAVEEAARHIGISTLTYHRWEKTAMTSWLLSIHQDGHEIRVEALEFIH